MNTAASPPHEGCMMFVQFPGALERTAIHRFVLGEDREPRALSAGEAAAELGDPFATLLLLKGIFPGTAGDVLDALRDATDPADSLRQTQFFLLGEGSQITLTPETAEVQRDLRFLVSCGGGPDGPDIILSAFHPEQSDVEVMAWDHDHGGFNYYRTVGNTRAWVFAGNARHALSDPTQGNGPFEAHHSGAFLMKELRAPWINWHSPDANIQPSVFAEDDALRTHEWFVNKAPLGAFTCETTVARPAITRWAKARLGAVAAGGTISDPARILRQVLESAAVNLVTSHTESANAPNVEAVDLPQTFFVDSEALTELLGLAAPAPINVPAAIYRQALETFGVTFTDGRSFTRPGDTHFAFCVPERAFEDQAVIAQAMRAGLLSDRLVAALLMTDFPNPIFSDRRAALLRYVPATATVVDRRSDFSETMANAILTAAEPTPEGSPEREFASLWSAGHQWRERFGELLSAYYAAVTTQVATQDGFDAFMRLAEARRDVVRPMPITESQMLFATTNIGQGRRRMRADATVEEV
ncbi:MAG TPA: hypothetical protein VK501_14970 [Baekduia sp.]|uniref:hypothetical protein n=1 Tax=Baekduia sp. TaxID=2600305 RepID=UPI002C85AB97|nr:hypothetical protein [Baekduia sp.]HMJ35211.1 hypothetical protein [Baekduia sp.]